MVIVTTSFPNCSIAEGQEAAGSFVYDFVVELARYVKVTAVVPGISSGKDKLNANFTIHRFYVPSLPLSLLKPLNPLQWPDIIKTIFAGQKAVKNIVHNDKIDHILALWALPSGYWAKTSGKKVGVPYSVWALGSDIWTLGDLPIVKNVVRSVLRDAFECFADGYQLKQDVEKISRRPCEFLPSTRTFPMCEKSIKENPPYNLAFLGRWHINKGTDILSEALGLLTEHDWGKIREIRICGGGPIESHIQSDVKALQLKGHPVFTQGYLNKDEAVELLLWADYILIPSRIESIPVIFSDAMKCNCPVICTPVGDLPRLLKNYRVGVLSRDVSAPAFAEAISESLQTNPSLFRDGIKACTKEFSMDKIIENLLQKCGLKA